MKKVMIVEDDEMVQKLLAKICQTMGLESFVAGDRQRTEDAIQAVDSFDLAVVDLIMPFITGWEVIDRLRSSGGKGATLPIIVLTGANVSEQEKERLLERVSEVIWKGGFTYKDFVETLKKWLPAS